MINFGLSGLIWNTLALSAKNVPLCLWALQKKIYFCMSRGWGEGMGGRGCFAADWIQQCRWALSCCCSWAKRALALNLVVICPSWSCSCIASITDNALCEPCELGIKQRRRGLPSPSFSLSFSHLSSYTNRLFSLSLQHLPLPPLPTSTLTTQPLNTMSQSRRGGKRRTSSATLPITQHLHTPSTLLF